MKITRIAAALIALGAAAGILAVGAGAVQAATPQTKTVVWAVPAGLGDRFAQPQLLAADTSACGQYQVDVYDYSTRADRAIVDGLLASGRLTAVADDTAVFRSGHDVVTTTCSAAGKAGPTPITVAAGAAGAGDGSGGATDGLAFTGTNARLLELGLGAAVVLVGGGAVLTAVGRSRRRD